MLEQHVLCHTRDLDGARSALHACDVMRAGLWPSHGSPNGRVGGCCMHAAGGVH